MFRLNAEFRPAARRTHRGRLRPRPLVHRQEALEYGFVDHVITPRRHIWSHQITPDLFPRRRVILPVVHRALQLGASGSNPYNKLFEDRIIFLGVQVDDASANDIMAQLLVLESLDPDRDITMYINSPGGSFTSLMAIYDTMQYVRADIQTVCLGQAASAAAVLLAAGTPASASPCRTPAC